MGKLFVSGLISGTISGLLLFLIFSYVQWATDIQLMTLLLDTRFMFAGDSHILFEVMLHLIISIVIAAMLRWLYDKQYKLYLPAMVVIWLVTTVLYFVLSSFAAEPLELNSYIGMLLWVIFHIGYLEVLHLCFKLGI